MTLYLLEINDQGLVQQLAITEGELDDFKDSTSFKAFTSYEEASSKLGKRWTGNAWEDVPKQEEEEKPTEEHKTADDMLKEVTKELKEVKAVVMELGMASIKPPSELPKTPPELPKLNNLPPLPDGMTMDIDALKSAMGEQS